MVQAAAIPGVTFAVARVESEPSPLRSDVAAFIGQTRRGPVEVPVRIEGWRHFERVFGGLWAEASMPYAIHGYFENGGQVAHVVRGGSAPHTVANGLWEVGALDPAAPEATWAQGEVAGAGFAAATYTIEAASPGAWGAELKLDIQYRRSGPAGIPGVDMQVTVGDEPREILVGLQPGELTEAVQATSALIRVVPLGPHPLMGPGALPGPAERRWQVRLSGGTDPVADVASYQRSLELLLDEPEAAIFVFSDLYDNLFDSAQQQALLVSFAVRAAPLLDRMAVVDLPETVADGQTARSWVEALGPDIAIRRTLAAYHPWIKVDDPLGGLANRLRTIPPSGHVAGVISRIDRERGAFITPANADLLKAVDSAQAIEPADQAVMGALGVNMLRCFPGRGLRVWGGRMLNTSSEPPVFVAHRRLLHRLVRAIRRVAEPLVFESNGPELWYSLARAATTVLLEAFRAGALKGTRPEEAFQVRCDGETNPPEERDRGRALCEISVAPAVPMEFITLRIALSADGALEVIEP